jgi:hypothetical protein
MNILWLHDNINDHKEVVEELQDFEKLVRNFTDSQSCLSFLKNAEQQHNSQSSILVVVNRIGRQIGPEIHSYRTLSLIVGFYTKDNKRVKWANKYSKVHFIHTCSSASQS